MKVNLCGSALAAQQIQITKFDKLKGLNGDDFDKEFVSDMLDDHEKDVSTFQKESQNSTDPDVKAFAAKTLPVLQKHLDTVKGIQSKMKQ